MSVKPELRFLFLLDAISCSYTQEGTIGWVLTYRSAVASVVKWLVVGHSTNRYPVDQGLP